ncbi:hypothetical protein EVG20_g4891 [Dentipellis fragilis]|uniref:Uncharacterized protein n=1 Tax=Dentipellis fragilis TaxID=205917 RepID=A0A4Y9YUF1_9AGAM|nr:hypothetical protein EVG20_g4891 [Dentipellis fragilis]
MDLHRIFLDEDRLDAISNQSLSDVAAACNVQASTSIMGIKILLLARFPEGVPVLSSKKEPDSQTRVIFCRHNGDPSADTTSKLSRKPSLNGLATPSPTPGGHPYIHAENNRTLRPYDHEPRSSADYQKLRRPQWNKARARRCKQVDPQEQSLQRSRFRARLDKRRAAGRAFLHREQ